MLKSLGIVAIVIGVVFAFRYLMTQGPGSESAQKALQAGKDFLATNKNKEGVQTTASGLQYKFLKQGKGGATPTASDKVEVHYHGTLTDGTVFDSSKNRGQSISFPLNRVIAGWTEGLQLMSEGDEVRLFIPSELAYGKRKAGSIPPNSALIFDVELIKINP